MALLPIITAPDARLKAVSEPVEKVDDEIRQLMDDMLETMYAAPGIGLAAIQVGVPKRVIVVDISKDEGEKSPLYLINPEVVWASDEVGVYEEGCLSVPDYYEEVERPLLAHVNFLDYNGELQTLEAEGLLAVCVQHEIDHLEGILFVDHLSRLKRQMILKKLSKAKKLAENA